MVSIEYLIFATDAYDVSGRDVMTFLVAVVSETSVESIGASILDEVFPPPQLLKNRIDDRRKI
jgi:hypothetical protein